MHGPRVSSVHSRSHEGVPSPCSELWKLRAALRTLPEAALECHQWPARRRPHFTAFREESRPQARGPSIGRAFLFPPPGACERSLRITAYARRERTLAMPPAALASPPGAASCQSRDEAGRLSRPAPRAGLRFSRAAGPAYGAPLMPISSKSSSPPPVTPYPSVDRFVAPIEKRNAQNAWPAGSQRPDADSSVTVT